MLKQIRSFLGLNKQQSQNNKEVNEKIVPQDIVEKFISDSSFPYLVSFSRTGSHWLRMLMELYFDKASMKLLFNKSYKNEKEYTCYHTHDMDLDTERSHVIYLYRNPVDTIYSQMNYYKQDLSDGNSLDQWSSLYGRHLDKWLYKETFTTKKTVLTYENLKKNLPSEFKKLTDFFGYELDSSRIISIADQATKDKIKDKTSHDPQVISLNNNYLGEKETFKEKNSNRIFRNLEKINPDLLNLFSK